MKYIELENFRLFEKANKFELAPVTVMVGKNNSGKSSIFKAMMLLNDYLNSDDQTQLMLDGPLSRKHKLTKISNVLNWNASKKEFRFAYHNEKAIIDLSFHGTEAESTASLKEFNITLPLHGQKLKLKKYAEKQWDLEFSFGFLIELEETRDINYPEIEQGFDNEIGSRRNVENLKQIVKSHSSKLKEEKSSTKPDKEKLLKHQINLDYFKDELKKFGHFFELEKQSIVLSGDLNDIQPRTLKIGGIIESIIELYTKKSVGKKQKLIYEADQPHLRKMVNDYRKLFKHEFSIDSIFRNLHTNFNFIIGFELNFLGTNRYFSSNYYVPASDEYSEMYQLLKSYKQNYPDENTIGNFVNHWLQKFSIARKFEVDDSTPPLMFLNLDLSETPFISTKYNKKGLNSNGECKDKPTDLGFGAGQILSIILKIAGLGKSYSKPGQQRYGRHNLFQNMMVGPPIPSEKIIIVLEEPESNLHPKLQSLLADMLLDAARGFDINIIIETHSEYLIRRSQVIAKDEKNTNYFKVYYLENGSNYEMKYLENGRFENEFGKGFYDEASIEALKLL
jgi:AAA15 family ATPase/GTPase